MGYDENWIAPVLEFVKGHVGESLRSVPMLERFDVDEAEAMCRNAVGAIAATIFEVWAEEASACAVELARRCPQCGRRRKVHRRDPMVVTMLGVEVLVPKPYLDCGGCDAPGISIMRVLTGLRSGSRSAELELTMGYLGAQASYGKASRDVEVHHRVEVERTAARRMALSVEAEALRFAERGRADALNDLRRGTRTEGVPCLMMQADGGTVRVGELRPTTPADPQHNKLTATGRRCRAKDVSFREVITMDIRDPRSATETCMDVLVPNGAPEGERSRRMLALGQRAGLGDNTQVRGLGDMGSSLATSFDEAFFAYDATYCADWKHTTDYVEAASKCLTHKAPQEWGYRLKDAIWERDGHRTHRLIDSARKRRVGKLPSHLDKCPVEALATYVDNNWDRFHAKAFHDAGLDFVSARAEAQVRDRTKGRFRVAGTWRPENLDGKATLRAIISDGRWQRFRDHYLREKRIAFRRATHDRVNTAINEHRLASTALDMLGFTETPSQRLAA